MKRIVENLFMGDVAGIMSPLSSKSHTPRIAAVSFASRGAYPTIFDCPINRYKSYSMSGVCCSDDFMLWHPQRDATAITINNILRNMLVEYFYLSVLIEDINSLICSHIDCFQRRVRVNHNLIHHICTSSKIKSCHRCIPAPERMEFWI